MADSIAVQFSEDAEQTIITFLGITTHEPDKNEWPNSTIITTDDARYETYYNAQWPMIQAGLPAPGS